MQPLNVTTNLSDRVYQAILDEILDGRLAPGQHLVQEHLAASLGVSRQPVQQAMTLLKADGVVEEAGRRGLYVTAIDIDRVGNTYDLRGVLDGYAARLAARGVRDGAVDAGALSRRAAEILDASERAIASGSRAGMIRHDEAFHRTIYDFSGNPVLGQVAEPIWRFVRRAMAEVLNRAKPADDILREHHAILEAILNGCPDQAEQRAQAHTGSAADRLKSVLAEDAGQDRA